MATIRGGCSILRMATLVAGLALLVPGTAPRAAGEFESAGWYGEPWFGDDGMFLGCAISRGFPGTYLHLAIGEGDVVMLMVEDAGLGTLVTPETTARLVIDRRLDIRDPAEIDQGFAYVYLSQGSAFLEAFQRGANLTVDIDGRLYGYALTGTAAAVERARSCIVAHAGIGAGSSSSAGGTSSSGSAGDSAGSASLGDLYGAIAYSATRGDSGTAWNYGSQGEAESAALGECAASGAYDCAVAISFVNACGAVAGASNGAWGADWSTTRVDAENKAFDNCVYYGGGDCLVVDSQCTD